MCKRPPFNPDTDVELGIAYIAVFILMVSIRDFGLSFGDAHTSDAISVLWHGRS